jgi:hypothetical protein
MSETAESALEARAVRAAVEVAAAQGLASDAPSVVGRQSNLVIHLRPHAVVARVATATELRPGTVWPEREVAVARHLAGAGAPIVAPSTEIDPGPHRHDGLVLSFWELFEQSEERVDASEAGRALRVCHEALLDVLVEARAFQIAVWNAVFARRRPQGVERLEGRLSCLRRRPGWAA